MKFTIINPNSKTGILFFSGFGFSLNFFQHLKLSSSLLFIHDYTNLIFSSSLQNEIYKFAQNKTCYLLAWSCGVGVIQRFWQINECFSLIKFERKIAINGTQEGIHKTLGIPEKIFFLTLKNLNVKNFYTNTLENTINFDLNSLPQSPNNLKAELRSLFHFLTKKKFLLNRWDLALISTKDKIFPAKNQELSWQNLAKIIPISAPHFPFFLWESWEEILEI